jgi:hypothetical protein
MRTLLNLSAQWPADASTYRTAPSVSDPVKGDATTLGEPLVQMLVIG